MARTTDQVLTELTEVADAIHATEVRLGALRQSRVELWAEARQLEPPVPLKELAAKGGVTSTEAIHKSLRARATAAAQS